MDILKVCFIIGLCAIQNVNSAKILGVFPMPSKSHHILASSLLKELANRGHEVTMISPYPSATPIKNYRDIDVSDILKMKGENFTKGLLSGQQTPYFQRHLSIRNIVTQTLDIFYNHNNTINLINSGEKFDVTILSWVWSESLLGLSHHFEAIPVGMCPIGPTIISNSVMDNPSPYSYVPNQILSFDSNMNFFQRVFNTLINFHQQILQYVLIYPEEELNLKQYFPNAPSLNELLESIPLVFVNSNPIVQNPQPLVPGIVDIGGLHISAGKLPDNIKTFLDNATEGAILFSLGSNVKSADLPKTKLNDIIKALHNLPVKVLWKYEDDNIKADPSKVLINKWLPQSSILAHKNIKAFVTHGGLLSITESIYFGVPIVGIPIFGDQVGNIHKITSKGFGVQVLLDNLTEESLTTAILKVVEAKRYRENVEEGSRIFRDQPVSPMDKAVYWIEYVLRHKGKTYLRNSSFHLKWYQYFLIDVIALLIVSVTAFLILTYFIFRYVNKSYCKYKKRTKSKSKIYKKKINK